MKEIKKKRRKDCRARYRLAMGFQPTKQDVIVNTPFHQLFVKPQENTCTSPVSDKKGKGKRVTL